MIETADYHNQYFFVGVSGTGRSINKAWLFPCGHMENTELYEEREYSCFRKCTEK